VNGEWYHRAVLGSVLHLENTNMDIIKESIRTIPDFPEPGIQFRDVTTLFNDARAFRMAIDMLLHPWAGVRIDKVAALEARGFIMGGAIAHQLSVGFVPIRKAGKLPGPRSSEAYTLEYGEAVMELHDGAIEPGERVLCRIWAADPGSRRWMCECMPCVRLMANKTRPQPEACQE